jgi:flagellar basal body P-ring formation protein FlgA
MRGYSWSLFLLAVLVPPASAFAFGGPVTVHLLDKATTTGPGISLAEVADVSGGNKVLVEKVRRLVVSRAAPAGEEETLTQAYVRIALRREGYSTEDAVVEGAGMARVLTESQELDPEKLLPMAKAFILGELKEDPENVEVKQLGLGKKVILPAGKMETHFTLPPTSDKFEGPILVNADLEIDGHWVKSLPLRLMVDVFHPAVVAKKNIEKGGKFTAENVGLVRTPTSKLAGQFFSRLDDVLGRMASQFLVKGTVVRVDSLYDPPVIKRGQVVEGIVQYGNVEISVQVRAVEDGKPGGTIRVENIDSNKLLQAKVLNDNTVLIERDPR